MSTVELTPTLESIHKELMKCLEASCRNVSASQVFIDLIKERCDKAFRHILADERLSPAPGLAETLVELAGPVGRPVNLGNNELLVEETTLNKVGLILVKAKGTRTPIPVEHERNVVGEVIQVEGPSLFMTWWPAYGEAPHPGDFLFMRLNVAKSEEVLVDEDRY